MGKAVRFKLNRQIPWLKIAIPIIVFLFLIGFLIGIFKFRAIKYAVVIPKTPMMQQAKVPERVFRGNLSGKKLVALTFDDGPAIETTPRLLDLLKEKGVVATFFELGMRVRSNPEITKRAVEEGHEVGSHTMYHQNLVRVSREDAEADIKEAKDVFRETLGKEIELTRLPYGNEDDFVRTAVGTPVVYWSVDTKDWDSKDTQKIVEIAVNSASDGAIILMHDIYSTTVDAVPEIIEQLRGQGYEFVTVSELADERGIRLSDGEVYSRFEP